MPSSIIYIIHYMYSRYYMWCIHQYVHLQVQSVIADLKGRGGKEWVVTLFVSDVIPLSEGGLIKTIKLSHRFMAMLPAQAVSC